MDICHQFNASVDRHIKEMSVDMLLDSGYLDMSHNVPYLVKKSDSLYVSHLFTGEKAWRIEVVYEADSASIEMESCIGRLSKRLHESIEGNGVEIDRVEPILWSHDNPIYGYRVILDENLDPHNK